jgi:hypothetical protein
MNHGKLEDKETLPPPATPSRSGIAYRKPLPGDSLPQEQYKLLYSE